MEKFFTEEEILEMVDEYINEHMDTLTEDEPTGIPRTAQPAVQNRTVRKPIVRKPVPPVKPNINKPRPTSQTIPGPKDDKEPEVKRGYDPKQAKEKQQMSKTQYQIFNIKMRLGKLGLNDTIRRFAQSIHDFDINVTKNSKDKNDIQSYLAPAQGNLIALKGALESLEAEFDELESLLGEE